MTAFDLETAIQTWRAWLRRNPSFSEKDVEELENHIRDHIDEQTQTGTDVETAFRNAKRQLGTFIEFEPEFKKVRYGRHKRKDSLRSEWAWRAALYRSYLRSALRQVVRYRVFTLLNVGGLAIGIASCAIILMFIRDEWSYDRFHPDADLIYSLRADYNLGGDMTVRLGGVPIELGPTLVQEQAFVEHAVRWSSENSRLKDASGLSRQEKILFVDPSFLDVFAFDLLVGNSETALDVPNSLLGTPKMAMRYFGLDDPVGQVLVDEKGVVFSITGVIDEPPHNTAFEFDFVSTYSTITPGEQRELGGNGWSPGGQVKTFIKLADGTARSTLESALAGTTQKYMPEQAERFNVVADRLIDLHLSGEAFYRPRSGLYGDLRYVWMFAGIAALILLIACINYANLSTARAIRRSREVGILKAVGARRRELVEQFLGESVFLGLTAMVLALALGVIGIPAFNQLIGKPVETEISSWIYFGVISGAIAIFAGICSGFYPAAVLSRIGSIHALRGHGARGQRRSRLRAALVTFQFVMSIGLIICTIVMVRQLKFMVGKDLGLQPDQVVSIKIPYEERASFPTIRNELEHVSGVLDTAAGDVVNGGWLLLIDEGTPFRPEDGNLAVYDVDHRYLPLLGIDIVAGRNFAQDEHSGGATPVLLNETAVASMKIEEPVGQLLNLASWDSTGFEVIGVVRDFHFRSARGKIEPLMIQQAGEENTGLLLKISTSDIQSTLAAVEAAWKTVRPDTPFSYSFLDEAFARLYDDEKRTGTLFSIAAMIAIVVSCLGLFGLAAFSMEQRKKEIGIRKVMGANVASIVMLVSTEFLAIVAISFAVAAPVAWFLMNRWLQDFAYRIQLNTGVLVIAGISTLVFVLATVSSQAVRAALTNPTKTLRTD